MSWSNFIKIVSFLLPSVHLISLNKKHGLKYFCDLFETKHTEFFYSCIFPLPYIVISEIGIRFFITVLVRTKFMLYRFSYFWFIVSMEMSITVKKYIQPNFNLFSKNWCNFHIDQSKGRLVKRQLKMLGMVQTKLY